MFKDVKKLPIPIAHRYNAVRKIDINEKIWIRMHVCIWDSAGEV